MKNVFDTYSEDDDTDVDSNTQAEADVTETGMVVDVRHDHVVTAVDTDGEDTTFSFRIVKGGCEQPSLVTKDVFRQWIEGSPPKMEMLSHWKKADDPLALARLGLLLYVGSIEEDNWRVYIFTAAEELALVHSFLLEIGSEQEIPKFTDADIIKAGKPGIVPGGGKFKKIVSFLVKTHIEKTTLSPFAYGKLFTALPRRRKQESPKRKPKDSAVLVKKQVPVKRKREGKDPVEHESKVAKPASTAAVAKPVVKQASKAESVSAEPVRKNGTKVTIETKTEQPAVVAPCANRKISATFEFTDADTFMSCIEAIFSRRVSDSV